MTKKMVVCGAIATIGAISLHYYISSLRKKRITKEDVLSIANSEEEEMPKISRYKDLTAEITKETVIYPGDPVFSCEDVAVLGESSEFHLRKFTMGNHTGTHIDFPAHVIKGGKTSSDYSIDDLIGDGLILEVPDGMPSIKKDFILMQGIKEKDIVFFKTSNSCIPKDKPYRSEYVYIEADAARAMLDIGVRIVGIDYISVDSPKLEALPVHEILLSNDTLIVENLNLKGVSPGRCKIFIMPINIPKMDGLPARVVMGR